MDTIIQLLVSSIQEDIYLGIILLSKNDIEEVIKIVKQVGPEKMYRKGKIVVQLPECRHIKMQYVECGNYKYFIGCMQFIYYIKDELWNPLQGTHYINLT